MLESLVLQRTLLNGISLSLILGVIILGSLRYNARLWLQDYPKPIRDKVPPLSPGERRDRGILVVLVFVVLIGGLILETMQLRGNAAEKISFGAAYLNIFLFLAVFNLFDALVLDLLILTWFTPRFVILPGTEGMEYLFRDYSKQFADFLKGILFCVVASLPFAVIAALP